MRIVHGLESLSVPLPASAVTIGNFDGLHRGHRLLLEKLLRDAQAAALPSVLLTFDPHPIQVLFPERALKKLFWRGDLERELQRMGLDCLVVQPFSREFSEIPAEAFIAKKLVSTLHPQKLIVGYDFSFGAGRGGSIDLLKALAPTCGFSVEVVPALQFEGAPISSRRIRQSLLAGKVEVAAQMLGRPFVIHGVVVRGDGRGRQIGIPTANLKLTSETVPMSGVYATQVLLKGKTLPAVTNVGLAPTFSLQRADPVVETHVLDLDEDLYGCEVELRFLKHLRSEKKFASLPELVAAIHADIQNARQFFAGAP